MRVSEIWHNGAAFNGFRGTDWMPTLCQSCDRRDIDFGGCRCQAMALLGDATAPDPVCRKSAGRAVLDRLLKEEADGAAEFVYRRP